MKRERIYLSPPNMGGYEQTYINEAFESNWVAPLGPNVDEFEKELCNYVNSNAGLALSSGTSAIHLALKLLEIGKGDIVFCSSLTFVASANPILYLGAKPVFIDSEPYSWNMSPVALEKALNKANSMNNLPKAIIVVNLYGQSAEMNSIVPLCQKYNVPIIEDAAESLGATYNGKASGTFGEYGVYSFNGNKIITTSGGGMLISNNVESIEKARFWSTQSREKVLHYEHIEVGYNYRLSNILAGIGRGQLKVLDEYINAKREVFNRYHVALSNIPGFNFMPELKESRSTRWLTTLTINKKMAGISSLELINELSKYNIESRPVWKPLHLQPLFSDCEYFKHMENMSVSDQLYLDGICLPSGSDLSVEDQDFVINTIVNILAVSKI
ncbi:pyridoxal phosphate-dependent aminotransferase [Paenibacillus helianthi]|uniref:Pyridoxal phosphate-dependent aminotransferase n=1 Tax=Paenibacillus helianthi TaxID=1349432 RepID=A0ABX3EFJ6_9BACL|nr:aminotransferase class I/II-fold pyridoxal phosphate-dependent enzyme [Paenibacillus helianthi]OKP78418.1 pyridoxal phosphate-dependent aminotransferase [Paenibacillus helianthi]